MTALKDFVSHVIDGIRETITINKSFKDLKELSDRELKDIGISRSDINNMPEKTFGT